MSVSRQSIWLLYLVKSDPQRHILFQMFVLFSFISEYKRRLLREGLS